MTDMDKEGRIRSQTLARLIVLENAVRQLWMNFLTNTDDPVEGAKSLEQAMNAMAIQAGGENPDFFEQDVIDASKTFWGDLRLSVEHSI